ncbi:MAG: putative kinase, galactokinase and mevalonate kinase like protein [Holophagaceae bacterium]|nr:putative kinase, galactokinase and mevalonate kinase like protein [Holophagaceae bacterium]
MDLAGGTLDLWPIYALMEGCVTVNAAVDLWIEMEVERAGEGFRVESRDLELSFESAEWPEAPPVQELSWVWRVMDAAQVRPARLALRSPVPQGSGLGTSSCMGVGLLGVCEGLEAGPALAARVPLLRDLEARELRTPTGWQDYFPAALGGCLTLHWDLPEPRWETLSPHPELLEDLVVFYTGKPHHSGLTNWDAYRRFIEGDQATREALEEIRNITLEMVLAVPRDAAAVGVLLEREGKARCRLSPSVETDAMRAVRDRGRREGWYAGMKPCGAGGGGCCLLVTPKGRREEARAALVSMGLLPLDVSLTSKGLHRLRS